MAIRPTANPIPSLLILPVELQLQISTALPYPDALSLKHTCRHFYRLVDTGIRLKVTWLLERKTSKLDIPKRKCILKTDEAFCSSREIRGFMEKRRRHQEFRKTHPQNKRPFTTNPIASMSSFSNADTGSKPADPYKQKNLDNNASLRDKVEDLVAFIDSSKFGMMTTRAQNGLLVSRCMALAAKEGGGLDLIFHTNTESGKTDDLHKDPSINMSFINSSGEWASLSGEASIITDRDVVHKYYSRALKAWIGDLGDGKYDAGPDDPRIGVIKLNAKTATYAVSDRSAVSRGVQIAKGVVTGDSPNVHKLRELDTDEIQQWRQLHQSS